MTTLAGARVLITGASRGVGAALARAFAAEGAVPALVARDEAAITALARELGGRAYPVDLATGTADLVRSVEADGGPVDILVNNAGATRAGALFRQDAETVRGLIELNLAAPVELCRQVLPGMIRRGRGHLVTVSSLAATAVFPGMAGYAAAKAGLAQFTAGLRADLRGLPVRTTTVDLGPVPTGALDDAKRYRPAAESYRRFYRARLLTDVGATTVAARIVRAVERDARHVRIPRRTALLPMLADAPRRVVELLLTGIDHQDRPGQG